MVKSIIGNINHLSKPENLYYAVKVDLPTCIKLPRNVATADFTLPKIIIDLHIRSVAPFIAVCREEMKVHHMLMI